MIRDLLIYLAIGAMIVVLVFLIMVDTQDFAWMSSDYTRALKSVGWLVK